MPNTAEIKEVRIDVRTSKAVKSTIKDAADLLGTTISAFIISRAYEEAKTVLSEHQTLNLSKRDMEKFISFLENPPEPNEALKKLLLND